MNVRCSADTHIGRKREVNQDSYGIGDLSLSKQRGYLLVVCDGMGGHSAGEVASRLGVETILAHYYATKADTPQAALEHAFYEANRRIYDQSQGQGQGNMGTTGVAALLLQNTLYIANVGDSRAYLVRDDQIEQISRDHSLVAEQVAAGIITTEQARHSHYRNMITRALGYRPEVQVDVFAIPTQPGDVVVLSSDGLHSLVEDDEIEQIVKTMPPDRAVQHLINTANDRGGTDNITVALALVDELDATGEISPPEGDDITEKLTASPVSPKKTTPLDAIDDTPSSRALGDASPVPQSMPRSSANAPTHAASSRNNPPASAQTPSSFALKMGLLGGAVVVVLLGVLGFVASETTMEENSRDAAPLPRPTITTPHVSPPLAGSVELSPRSGTALSTPLTTTRRMTSTTQGGPGQQHTPGEGAPAATPEHEPPTP